MVTTGSQPIPSRAEPSFGSQPGMRAAPLGWKSWLAALLHSVDGARPPLGPELLFRGGRWEAWCSLRPWICSDPQSRPCREKQQTQREET